MAIDVVPTTTLAECEAVIERGLTTFVEVGEALLRIRDKRLYRESHDTFEDYCRERWGWGRNYANKTIAAAEAVQCLGTTVPNVSPPSVRVARELAPLRDDPEVLREAWADAIERYGEQPTAAQMREVVQDWRGDASTKKGDDDDVSATADAPVGKRQTWVADAAKERLERAVGICVGLRDGLPAIKLDLAMSVATPDEIESWKKAFREGMTALRDVDKRLGESS